MKLAEYRLYVGLLTFGKHLPTAVYIVRLDDWTKISPELAAMIERGIIAAKPNSSWNVLKLHTDQVAITFLTYPNFDEIPHPSLAESTKINLNTGAVVRTDYRKRANPPILHRKEAFLPPDDPRRNRFQNLTKQEEAAGLYKDPSRIGLRIHWQTLLKRLGLTYDDHNLIRADPLLLPDTLAAEAQNETPAVVDRHRTAIKRYDLSKPVKLALERGLLRQKDTFFDYGCGHGMDIEGLSSLGYSTAGWDPAFRPEALKQEADVVNLGYVLNVIENPTERIDALRAAFALTRKVLLVSTLAAGQESEAHVRPLGDGFLTKTNTFQKFFGPNELESLIEETLGVEAITLTLGICAAFKDPDDAEVFEASRQRRKIDWSQIGTQLSFATPTSRERHLVDRYDLNRDLLDSFWRCLLDLGRAPEPGEFDQLSEIRRIGRGLTKTIALVVQKNGPELWELARKSRTEDVLVYLAMSNFRKKFLRRDIPPRIKSDIKAFFPDLQTAKERARDILFAAGDPGEVELAVETLEFGLFDQKELQFTFHRSFLDRLPPVLRVYVNCGALRYGDPHEADLIKIHVRSRKLTFLHYKDFEKRKQPILLTRIKINLRTQFVEVFDHTAEQQCLLNKRVFFS